ncbi:MAG: hypothetical protein WBA68_12535 [Alteraurantiacibacter sp.]
MPSKALRETETRLIRWIMDPEETTDRIAAALIRIEAAAGRIEAACAASEPAGDAELEARYANLQKEAGEALKQLDLLIESVGQ